MHKTLRLNDANMDIRNKNLYQSNSTDKTIKFEKLKEKEYNWLNQYIQGLSVYQNTRYSRRKQ